MATVFFSYSHKDEALRDQLESHLALLKNQGLIDAWHDRRIVGGDNLEDAIFDKLETADIILLLVSSDFIASPYCYSKEMSRALERHEAGSARVMPVILRHCDWTQAPFGKVLAVPRDGKPVTSWTDIDEALADVARQIRRAVESLTSNRGVRGHVTRRPPPAAKLVSCETAGAPKPRSSNLRLKKEFTDQDKDSFLRVTFEYICNHFEGSVEAIDERNSDVTGTFERIDSRRMAAVLYRAGKTLAECSVRLEGGSGRGNGIAFSRDASATPGSYNEMLQVESTDQSLYLEGFGMSWNSASPEKQLSQEGAAEYFWSMFIGQAQ